jgi:hypothetical protein
VSDSVSDPPTPASLPHTQPVITPGAISDLRARVERLERRVDALDRPPAPRPTALEQRLDAWERTENVRELHPAPPAPTDDERAAWVEYVLGCAVAYSMACEEPTSHNERLTYDRLRAAVTALAAGRDPREVSR